MLTQFDVNKFLLQVSDAQYNIKNSMLQIQTVVGY